MAPKAAAGTTKAAKKAPKAGGAKRKSPYNDFMREELARIKAATPGIEHRAAFKQAASNWKKTKPAAA